MLRLKTLLGPHPQTLALRNGEARSDVFTLDFADEPVPHEAFKPFVRELAFDCGELAIVTLLQALAFGKPLSLLPVVVSARFHQGSIGYNRARGTLGPKDLEGRVVAVRTYAQTTGVWVRGILQDEYGVDLSRLRWLTFDEAHLAEYVDPVNCERAPPGSNLEAMLLAGEVDAGIPIALASPLMSDPRIGRVIPDPESAARAWSAARQAVPINHVLVVRRSLIDERPEAVRELYRLFSEAKARAPASGQALDLTPIGIEPMRRGLERVIRYAAEQKIIPRIFSVDEIFADARRVLGDEV